MVDITMCTGGGCPLKEHCYRYKARPSPFRQSFFMTPPYIKKNVTHNATHIQCCKDYWPIEDPADA